jgi:oxygen-independent coproporphyrinogen-3 oxidase
MRLPPLGLYIHLPWCQRKCPYCDFNSHEVVDIPEPRYIDALLRDLHNDLPLVQGREVETVFIGGGTPSLFSAASIRTLLNEIANRLELATDVEITMEANPGSAEAKKFRALREAGINRLSLGIQSFDDEQLQALGRVHDSEQAFAAIESAQHAGFDSLNLDLMHGLPGQTLERAERDLLSAIAAGPGHLSWYQLTIEPNTVFHKRPPVLPHEDVLGDIQDRGEQLLSENGYGQYEVSAYSRDGFQCRHNRNYWTFGDYLGIGAGAHGKITFSDAHIERYAKRRQPDEYMSANFVAGSRTLAADELVGEFMMNALRLNEGFTLAHFNTRTGLDNSVLENRLDSLYRRDLLVFDGGAIRTTGLGRRFLDSVVAEFFPDQP